MTKVEEQANDYCSAYYDWDNPAERKAVVSTFMAGYAQAEYDLGWHSVEDALPEMDEEVIVLTDELNLGEYHKICFGHIVNKEYCEDYDGWNIPGVKFWMPMPEIPGEEKK